MCYTMSMYSGSLTFREKFVFTFSGVKMCKIKFLMNFKIQSMKYKTKEL